MQGGRNAAVTRRPPWITQLTLFGRERVRYHGRKEALKSWWEKAKRIPELFSFAEVVYLRNNKSLRKPKACKVLAASLYRAMVLWVTRRKFGGFKHRSPCLTVSHSSTVHAGTTEPGLNHRLRYAGTQSTLHKMEGHRRRCVCVCDFYSEWNLFEFCRDTAILRLSWFC